MQRLHSCSPHPRRSRSSTLATFGTTLVLTACGEPLPDVPLDIANHDRCSMSLPYVVDASASEIQCLVEDYLYVSYADDDDTMSIAVQRRQRLEDELDEA